MTVQEFDQWLILALSLWFVPKGLLFFITWAISKQLTPADLRSELGDAYRGIFASLGFFSLLMAAIFFLRWIDDRPVMQDGPVLLLVIIRACLVISMAFVTWQEIRAIRALIVRWRRHRALIRERGLHPNTEVERCLQITANIQEGRGVHDDV